VTVDSVFQQHQLAAISAPILRLPRLCRRNINVDTPILMLLLVSKRWNAVAAATPQLWSKIVLYGTNFYQPLRLKGAHICKSLEHLSFVLSLAKNVPLDIELACAGALPPRRLMTSQNPAVGGGLMMGPSEMMDPSETDFDWRNKSLGSSEQTGKVDAGGLSISHHGMVGTQPYS
jgi:hypothetical protein